MNMDFAYKPTTWVRETHETPVVPATEESVRGYGRLVG